MKAPLLKPTNPTKGDSTFAGWYKDEALTQAFDFDTETITADITLHAKWIIVYTVAFNLNGGTPNEEDKIVEAGTLLTQPQPHPTKEGNTFVGWYNDEALTQAFDFNTEKITQNITLYAKWTPITYTVAFDLNGGTPNEDDKTVAHGERVQQPQPDPTKTDSVFAGWYKDQALTQAFNFATEKITQPITLYAKWEPPTGVAIPDANFRAKLQALIPGAFEGEKLDATSDEVTGLKTLTIQYAFIKDLTGIEYFKALTLLSCHGNSLVSLDVSKNTALTWLDCRNNRLTDLDVSKNEILETLSCNNNQLDSLDVSVNTVLTRLSCQGNLLTHLDIRGMRSVIQLNIQADDKETNVINTLKVHENLKDHAQVSAVKTARGDEVTIATYSAAAGSTEYTLVCSDYDPTADSEANRCGDEVKYTVTFNSRGGSLINPISLYREGPLSKPTNPTKTDSVFAGWYKDEALTQAFNFATETITADITLYAKWEARTGVTIPDVNFRNKLKALIPGAFVGEKLDITSDEVTGRTGLDVKFAKIQSLEGIQYFTGLTSLSCSGNQLTDLDVSRNIELITLYCESNPLGSLDVSKNTRLVYLYCASNSLDSLDVSKNTELIELNCPANSLAKLDVSRNIKLRTLFCNSNQLTDLDVSKNKKLTVLECSKNLLTYLDMRGMESFRLLSIQADDKETNVINTLKVHENLKDHAQISAVKTARGDEVTIATYSAAAGSTEYTLVCSDYDPTADSEADRCGDEVKYTVTFNSRGGSLINPISLYREGPLSKPTNPTKTDSVFAGWYKDEALTQAFNFATETITADITLYAKWEARTGVTIPDVNFRNKLKALIPGAFVGEKLDTTSDEVTGRTGLGVSSSNIGDLTGIRYFTALTALDCSSNRLTELDVSKNIQLTALKCRTNQLTGLDVSKNIQLTTLECRNNRLTGLDVSKNIQLTALKCRNNRLTDLDVSKNTALTELSCAYNRLTHLDVSKNTALTELSCAYNRLTHLDMTGMRSVNFLSIQEDDKETNVINTLKVHENLKDHAQISAVKSARGDEVTIETYSATAGSTVYTAVCNDYDPTETDEQNRCKDAP